MFSTTSPIYFLKIGKPSKDNQSSHKNLAKLLGDIIMYLHAVIDTVEIVLAVTMTLRSSLTQRCQ